MTDIFTDISLPRHTTIDVRTVDGHLLNRRIRWSVHILSFAITLSTSSMPKPHSRDIYSPSSSGLIPSSNGCLRQQRGSLPHIHRQSRVPGRSCKPQHATRGKQRFQPFLGHCALVVAPKHHTCGKPLTFLPVLPEHCLCLSRCYRHLRV